jgi:branched-chain amino acid transport system permease protein
VAAALGLAVAVPALRVRGVNLAVVTLAAGVAVEALVFRNPSYTGGLKGSVVPEPRLFGVDLGIRGRHPGQYPRVGFALLVLAVLVLLALALANLRRSASGRRMLAVRANERAATAAGVDTAGVKLLAFCVSAFLAGVAGSLVGYQQGRLSFDSFGVFVSLGFLAYAYLGGVATVGGALVGGLLVGGGLVSTALDRWLGLGRFHLLLSGAGLVAVAVLVPEGIAGAVTRAVDARRRPPPAGAPVADTAGVRT